MTRTAPRLLRAVLAAATIALLSGLAPQVASAAPAASAPANRCAPDPSVKVYVRAELVDRSGRPSGRFVDSRCTDRTLKAQLASPYHYLRHNGAVEPGSVVTVLYVRSDSGELVRTDTTVAGTSGRFQTDLVDLTSLMSPGQTFTIGADHVAPTPTAQQDLIEYALLT
jgi:hypothetical protein